MDLNKNRMPEISTGRPTNFNHRSKSNMIKPTIGRVVLVNRGKSDQREPALVSYVHNDRCINVGGFDSNGQPFSLCSLQLLQDDDKPMNPGSFAEWMPYQKGQAAKTEELEAQVKASTSNESSGS